MTGRPDPSELLEVAVEVAGAAAELARTYRADGRHATDVGTKSTETDLVTAADRAVERLIGQRLRSARPHDQRPRRGVRRAPGRPGRAGVRWVVDPIDGTVNYVYGLPQYAVSIAAQVDGVSVAGVVRNAATGEQWTAVRGGGALAGRGPAGRLHRDRPRPVSGGDRVRLRRRCGPTRPAVLAAVLPAVRDIRRFGAASIDLCLAAEGRVDAYFERGLNAWDHAAGGLIAEEAGLLVTGLRGAAPSSAMVLAAPPALHAAPARPSWPPSTPTAGPLERRHAEPGAAGEPRHTAQVPSGGSGLPMAAMDWLTSVVVASCWNLRPEHDVDLGAFSRLMSKTNLASSTRK